MIFNRLNIIVIGVLLLALVGLSIFCGTLSRKVDSLNSYKALYEASVTENKVWKGEDGLWKNNTKTVEITKDMLDDIKELENLHKEFSGIKKSIKNLENYMSVNSSTNITKTIKIKDAVIYNAKDSSKTFVRHFAYKDKWQSDSVAIVGDSARFFHNNRDSLVVVGYWDRKWFLGKKSYFTEIKSYNPNTKIDYQRSIKVKRKKSLLF